MLTVLKDIVTILIYAVIKCLFTLIDREGTWMEEDTRSQRESNKKKVRGESTGKKCSYTPTPNVQCPEILEKRRFRTFKNFVSLLQYLSSPVIMVCKVSTL